MEQLKYQKKERRAVLASVKSGWGLIVPEEFLVHVGRPKGTGEEVWMKNSAR